MNELTLKEVCNKYGISRRAIQGYEKAGLVSATGKTVRGYLLYDELSQDRIKKIKLFQDMGFSIKEICEIIDAPPSVVRTALEKQLMKLKEECKQKCEIIRMTEEFITTL